MKPTPEEREKELYEIIFLSMDMAKETAAAVKTDVCAGKSFVYLNGGYQILSDDGSLTPVGTDDPAIMTAELIKLLKKTNTMDARWFIDPEYKGVKA